MTTDPRSDSRPSIPDDATIRDGEPPAPSRSRVVRPVFFRSSLTGSLPPDVRDLMIGIATVTDDEGWLLWRPEEIAVTVYPYEPTETRLADFHRRADALLERRLIVIEDCGCARMPRLKEHFGMKGGRPTVTVWSFHQSHRSVTAHASTDTSFPVSVSGSASSSVSGAVSGLGSGEGGRCDRCHRPTSDHDLRCELAPHLRVAS